MIVAALLLAHHGIEVLGVEIAEVDRVVGFLEAGEGFVADRGMEALGQGMAVDVVDFQYPALILRCERSEPRRMAAGSVLPCAILRDAALAAPQDEVWSGAAHHSRLTVSPAHTSAS